MESFVWLFVSAIIPISLIWIKYSNLLWKYRITLVIVVLLSFIIHVPWDVYAVYTNIWSFPNDKNLGINIVNLPLEEYLYTLFVPLLGASIALVAKYKMNKVKK